MLLSLVGCSSKAKKQAAFEAGQKQAYEKIEKKEAPTLDEKALQENLGAKVESKKTEVSNKVAVTEKTYEKVDAPDYYRDTNALQIHKRGGDCPKMQNAAGDVTLEPYSGDINALINDGYAKCPSCFIK